MMANTSLLARQFSFSNLTQREMEVLRLVFSGKTSKQIAQALQLSPRTVEVHRANILRKAGATNTLQLVNVVLQESADLEEALARSEAHLREAQRIAHLGSWSWDIGSGINTWSDEQFRIFGYPPQAMTPTYTLFFEHLHPDDHQRVQTAVTDALADRSDYALEYRIIRTDGEQRLIRAHGVVERDTAGKPVRMIGTLLDVTPPRG